MRKGKQSPRALDIDVDGGLVEEVADHGGVALLRWHRGKAGTVEHTHRVLEDELAAGVYPSAKFGANAAWLRLQLLTANLLILV